MLIDSLSLLQRLVNLRYGMTIAEMQAELGMTRRTTYRYLDAFKAAGIELETYRSEGELAKKWRIPLARRKKYIALVQTA